MPEDLSTHPLRDQRRPRRRPALDRSLPIVLAIVGAVLLFAGYWGVSDSAEPGEQLPYIASGTIPGAVLIIVAAILVLREEAARARQESTAASARLDALVEWLVAGSADPSPNGDTTASELAGHSR